MKKLLAIMVLGLLWSNLSFSENSIKATDVVTDPAKIKELNKLFYEEKEKNYKETYFNSIKCIKTGLFSSEDPKFFAINIKSLGKEMNAEWDMYKSRYKKYHMIKDSNQRYYYFYVLPGLKYNESHYYKIDRTTGHMYEINENNPNSQKKIRTCDKVKKFSDMPNFDSEKIKTKF